MAGDTCRLQISIADTGIGITEEQKSRLFRSFEQAETDTSRKFGGTGLGLAISKRIVELMGGEIWVESEPGMGAKFTFTVLLKYEADEPQCISDKNINWKKLRILVVDNEPDICSFFTSFSEAHGIACTTAASGGEALALMEKGGAYDICFLDWGLSGVECIEFARKIQEKAVKSVVLVHSSIDGRDIEERAAAAGVDKFLMKPLFPTAVIDMIHICAGVVGLSEQETAMDQVDDFHGYSILLAEDIEINREIVLAILESTNLHIDCAENGLQAFNLYAAAPEKYALIFMDLQMPEMDGFEATRRIRALNVPQAKTVPIIAMTANVFREDIDKCFEAGMNGHVGKPLDFSEVIGQLRKYLS